MPRPHVLFFLIEASIVTLPSSAPGWTEPEFHDRGEKRLGQSCSLPGTAVSHRGGAGHVPPIGRVVGPLVSSHRADGEDGEGSARAVRRLEDGR